MYLKGEIFFPGDKSISHRSLILAALCHGESKISNLSTGKDVQSTKNCLKECGIKIIEKKLYYIIKGGKFNHPKKHLDCGNSGTTARLLAGLLAGQGIRATLIGDKSLSMRPMKRIIDPLALMGLELSSIDNKLPMKIKPSKLHGIDYVSSISSAQVKSAVILAGIGATESTSYTEPILSRDHTEIMLKKIGVNIKTSNLKTSVSKISTKLKPFTINIPGDPSSAAFFAAGSAMIRNSKITLKSISGNNTRLGFYNILEKMGAIIKKSKINNILGEKIVDITVQNNTLKGISISDDEIPSIIDEIPIIAILASQADGKTEIRGAKELRYKESDRISSIVLNLKNMGANITELDDGMIIKGPTKLSGANITTFQDHRIAMSFEIANLVSNGNNTFDSIDCVNISFPEFFDTLSEIKR